MNFSVLMSVYHAENPEYLRQALQSLHDQTLRANEVVLVEDGPLPDELAAVIEAFRAPLNIASVKLETNRGLAVALNEGLQHCRHELVARMDSDDISLPQRFEKQIAFMADNSGIAASSAALDEFDENGAVFSSRVLPLTHSELVKFAKTRSPISHAAAVFRKSAVLEVGGYPLFKRSQDVALWSLLIVRGYRLANLPDKLFLVRAGAGFMSRNGLQSFKYEYAVICYQKKIGFLSSFDFLKNTAIRFILAVAPAGLKKLLYSHAKIDLAASCNAALKRAFDLFFSFLGLIFMSPLILLCWLAASLDTRSNGLFVQERVGRGGTIFKIYKIKTMREGSGAQTTVTTSADGRITRTGAFMRKTKLDELPQLWNVLAGDMSFVGPRPDVPGYADDLQGEDRIILSVRPGITGPASLKYKNEEEILGQQADALRYNREVIWPDKVKINKEYIRDYSFLKDLKYIISTVAKGAPD
ncbi:MAG: sugar transferase [Pollutimonas bauzanensis]|uniref:Sugar transferase involved in LPS biosynthesis (Colanic, teichoic acid) n=1 Tax=Pollutimonas bauzanensis TaxID=658167 RepID=A0A1M5YXC7_9BURK|nr:sugar transferase [Pollutimonas bauzanensis]SHI16696.1 Sugar transferase involved in LPS biosynthesis (colanic, teichoic acid) [Pollutimonas bauzanensis]